MRIGVDFHVYDGKFQGSRSHLLGVYEAMVRLFPCHDYYFFLENVSALRAIPAFAQRNVTVVSMPRSSSMARLLWQLPSLRRRCRLDVLHSQYVIPLWPARGNAVTIHDVLFEDFPQFFTRMFVLRSRLLMRRSACRADLVLTVSDYSRLELARHYAIDVGRITVVRNAVDATRFHPGQEGARFIEQRGLVSRRFLLAVGRIEPRKNYARLLRAFAGMAGDAPPLVIVGQRDFDFAEFDAALASLPSSHRVHVLTDVEDGELPALYRHALAFVYPSLAEGFGMPPLEAMASGVPVVTSASTAIPEVMGDAGLLVDPCDENALRGALERVCGDESLRARMIADGLKRAGAYTWSASAQRLEGALRMFAD